MSSSTAARALVAVVPITTLTHAQSPATTQERGTALVLGQVTEADSQRPVTGAVVTLLESGVARERATVDREGRFVFNALPAGRYTIRAEKAGYLRGMFGRTHPSGAASSLDLTDGQRLTGAEVTMWRFASINGRVLDDAGEPVVGAGVRTVPTVAGPAVTTDDRGEYRIAMLPPGTYLVVVPASVITSPAGSARDVEPAVTDPDTVAAEAGAGAVSLSVRIGNLLLSTTGTSPLPPVAPTDARVQVYQSTYHPSTSSRANSQPIVVASGEDRLGVDLVLTAVPSFSVSGRATGPDGPLASRVLRLIQGDGSGSEDVSSEAATALTDGDGRFTFLGVPRGPYVLRVLSPAISTTGTRPGAVSSLWAARPITVDDEDVVDLTVVLRAAPTLSGRIVVEGERTIASGFELVVQAIDGGPSRVINPRVDQNRRFSTQVAPGRYMFAAYAPGGAWCPSITINGREAFGEVTDIDDVSISDVVVICGRAPTRVIGTVRDDRGAIDSRTSVVAFPVDRRMWSGPAYQPLRLASVRVASSGVYAFTNLPPGEYFVAAIPDAESASWKELPQLERLSVSAKRVTLAPAQSVTLDLQAISIK